MCTYVEYVHAYYVRGRMMAHLPPAPLQKLRSLARMRVVAVDSNNKML